MLSTTLNKEITEQARASLSGNWGVVASAAFTSILISILLNAIPHIGPFTPFFITGAFTLSFAIIYLNISRGEEVEFSQLFSGFNDYIRAFLAYLLTTIFIILWFLLLVIPGIIAAYAYMLTFFILADDDSLTALEAIQKSKEMMQGYKWKAACLSARFVGWGILCILTFGIGFVWLLPYMGMSFAKFYEDIKQNEADMGTKSTSSTSF